MSIAYREESSDGEVIVYENGDYIIVEGDPDSVDSVSTYYQAGYGPRAGLRAAEQSSGEHQQREETRQDRGIQSQGTEGRGTASRGTQRQDVRNGQTFYIYGRPSGPSERALLATEESAEQLRQRAQDREEVSYRGQASPRPLRIAPSRSENEALEFLAEQQRHHASLQGTPRGRIIGNELHLGNRVYRLRIHPILSDDQTLSRILNEGTFLLNPTNRQGIGLAGLDSNGGAYDVLLVDTAGEFWYTPYSVVTSGLPQHPNGILVYTTRVVYGAQTRITARPPADTRRIAAEIVEMIRRLGVNLNPGIAGNAVVMILERHDLTNEEVMDVLQEVERYGMIVDLLQLIHDPRFRAYLMEKEVPWPYVFHNYRSNFNDSGVLFAGFLIGVGENLIDAVYAVRLVAVLAGSPFSEELADERDEFFSAIASFFDNPVVMAQAGVAQLYNTFVDHLYHLRFYEAGVILGHVTITLLTLPSAVRSLPSAARAIIRTATVLSRLTLRAVRALGVAVRDVVRFALRPRSVMVTNEGFMMMSGGDDILIIRPNGSPAGRISRDAVLREVSESGGPHGSGREPLDTPFNEAELDEWARRWDAEVEGRASSSEQTPRSVVPPFSLVELEDIVSVAIRNIRNRLGPQWLRARHYGTRLHEEVEAIIRQRHGTSAGWAISVEQKIDDFAHVPQRVKDMTIREFIQRTPALVEYEDLLERIFRSLDSRVGDKIPDLVIRNQGNLVIWDLTARLRTEHLAKSLFYAHVLRESGQFVHIGETYWRHFRRGFNPFDFYGVPSATSTARQTESASGE